MTAGIDDAIIETLLAETEPQPLAHHQRSKVLATVRRHLAELNAPFRVILNSDEGWTALGAGIHRKVLASDPISGVSSFLLRMEPGAQLPAHDHTVAEECLVLAGSVWMGADPVLSVGDYQYAPAGTRHQEISTSDGCVLFLRGRVD